LIARPEGSIIRAALMTLVAADAGTEPIIATTTVANLMNPVNLMNPK
jgi:hypothetical protein